MPIPFKYLFKYVYKGYDCANIEITEAEGNKATFIHDEVATFLDCRYVSSPEAFWRLSAFDMHQQSHTICRLAVHLPNLQPVYFREGHHEAALEQAATRETTLTAYFSVNAGQPTPYLYTAFPNHFTFCKKKWKPRKVGGSSDWTNVLGESKRH